MSRPRVVGTTIEAIQATEQQLGVRLPGAFVAWLLLNNGRSLGGLEIFPVFDARDPRKTWDSLVRHVEGAWQQWLDAVPEDAPDGSALLPFATFGTGDHYCFDYAAIDQAGEPGIVLWSHETGVTTRCSGCFAEFVASLDPHGQAASPPWPSGRNG